MYTVNGASVPEGSSKHSFPFQPRQFQAEFLDWLNNDNRENIVTLEAPTGAGKTATFEQHIKKHNHTLLVYPTNALIREQKETLSTPDIDILYLTSDKLEEKGISRRDELMGYATRGHQDAIITNPDILQAIIQNQYVDYNSKLMRFFDQFDSVIYDEYHFYNPFSASGILLQSKILVERTDADIIFSSATGNKIPKIISDQFQIPVRKIQSDVNEPAKGSQFRYDMNIQTSADKMKEHKDKITDSLQKFLKNKDDDEKSALIFNSVRDSNNFYNHIIDNTSIGSYVQKDNGYDTKSDVSINLEDSDILITTSKSEVGLNYNITNLYMEKPNSPSSFIQRIGRCARQQTANVQVYGIGSLPWNQNMEYSEFVKNVYEDISGDKIDKDEISELAGLRSAYAVYDRQSNSQSSYNKEILRDFTDVPHYDKWYNFISIVNKETNNTGGLKRPPEEYIDIMDTVKQSFDSLATLRGKSTNVTVKYPRGNDMHTTQYSLLSTLMQYDCTVENGVIVVNPKVPPREFLLDVSGLQRRPKISSYYDLQDIIKSYINLVEQVEENISSLSSVTIGLIRKYFNLIGYRNAIDINRVYINDTEIEL